MRDAILTMLVFLFAASCTTQPKSAEEVLNDYISSLNHCECDQALELSIDEAKNAALYLIENGCHTNEDRILSIACEETDNSAICNLRLSKTTGQTVDPYKIYNFTYSMTKVDGEWKVAAQWKSLNYPEELLDSLRSSTNAALNNESFDDFYTRFIADSIFQLSRVNFPLRGTYNDQNGAPEWEKEKWPLLQWDYREEMTNTRDSTSLIQTDSTFYFGTFCKDCGFSFWMEFEKHAGKWQLMERQENNF